MVGFDHRLMYIILRSDLLTELKWPVGAIATQAAHAATACIWCFREDFEVAEYMKDIDHLRKVTLKVLALNSVLSFKALEISCLMCSEK